MVTLLAIAPRSTCTPSTSTNWRAASTAGTGEVSVSPEMVSILKDVKVAKIEEMDEKVVSFGDLDVDPMDDEPAL